MSPLAPPPTATNFLPFAHHRSTAPAYWSDDMLCIMLATAQDTAGRFAVIEQLCAAHSGPGWHLHATQDETFYVLDGEVDFYVAGQTLRATPGAFISIPRGTAHRFVVTSDSARVLNAYYPAGFEQVIIGTGQPAPARTLPPAGLPLPDLDKGRALAEQWGLVLLPEAPARPTAPAAGPQPFMIYKEQGQAYWSVGILWLLMATLEDTGGAHCLLDELLPKGPAAPPHRHEAADEIFYLLDGEATFQAGEDMAPLRATAGSLVCIPRGTRHAFGIDTATAHLLNAYTPAGFEHTIAPNAVPATALTLPPDNLPPMDIAQAVTRIQAVAEQYPGSLTTVFATDFLNHGHLG